jgi:hypothetical protein
VEAENGWHDRAEKGREVNTEATTRKTYRKLGRAEQDRLNTFLRTLCEKDEDGFSVYSNGWTDEKVCEAFSIMVGHEVSVLTVGGTRRDLFGNFRTRTAAPKNPDRDNDIWAAIEDLRAKQEKAQGRIDALERRLDALQRPIVRTA